MHRRQRTIGLKGSTQAQQQAILKIRIGHQQNHGCRLLLIEVLHKLSEFFIGDRGRIQSHLVCKRKSHLIGCRPIRRIMIHQCLQQRILRTCTSRISKCTGFGVFTAICIR